MIMKLLAKRYIASNKDGKSRVIGYESRPMIKLTPPDTSKDRRVKNYTYIEAITKLPTSFTSAELRPILARARVHFKGKLCQTFVVLNDDLQPATQEPVDDVVVISESVSNGFQAPTSSLGSRKRGRLTVESGESESESERPRQ